MKYDCVGANDNLTCNIMVSPIAHLTTIPVKFHESFVLFLSHEQKTTRKQVNCSHLDPLCLMLFSCFRCR